MGRFPVEPFNTYSNLLFLAIVIYWWRKTPKGKPETDVERFLKFGVPILFVGYVGGTIYHATRSHAIWLILDFAPIAILAIWAAYLAWRRILKKRRGIVALSLIIVAIPRLIMAAIVEDPSLRISLGYFTLALPAIIPVLAFEKKMRWTNISWFAGGIGLFMVAITFRVLDAKADVISLLPMGSHWLWHTFGALAAHLLFMYFYKTAQPLSKIDRHTT